MYRYVTAIKPETLSVKSTHVPLVPLPLECFWATITNINTNQISLVRVYHNIQKVVVPQVMHTTSSFDFRAGATITDPVAMIGLT